MRKPAHYTKEMIDREDRTYALIDMLYDKADKIRKDQRSEGDPTDEEKSLVAQAEAIRREVIQKPRHEARKGGLSNEAYREQQQKKYDAWKAKKEAEGETFDEPDDRREEEEEKPRFEKKKARLKESFYQKAKRKERYRPFISKAKGKATQRGYSDKERRKFTLALRKQ